MVRVTSVSLESIRAISCRDLPISPGFTWIYVVLSRDIHGFPYHWYKTGKEITNMPTHFRVEGRYSVGEGGQFYLGGLG